MLKSRGLEIAKQLRDMFIRNRLGGLELDNKYILVQHSHGMLLLHVMAEFSQSMSQGVLVNFLQMTMPMVKMDGVSCLADSVTKIKDHFQIALSLCFFVPFCG